MPARRRATSKQGHSIPTPTEIRRWTLAAISSDDYFLQTLALKGGAALELVYQISSRPSKDLDFSMEGEFEEELESVRHRFESVLIRFFQDKKLQVFDLTLVNKPPQVSEDMKDFWGGYELNFKLIGVDLWKRLNGNLEQCRKQALPVTDPGGRSAEIDMSCHECLDSLRRVDIDHYQVQVYNPDALIFEKLQALCQQTPEYGEIVRRSRPGSPRPRDFFDIEALRVAFPETDLSSPDALALLEGFFGAKRVPLRLLRQLPTAACREFHRRAWPQLLQTLPPSTVQSYEFYYARTAALASELCESLGIPDLPEG